MSWIGSYLDVTIAVALLAFVVADTATRSRPGSANAIAAAVAGLVWPVLLIVLAEFLLIVTVTKSARVRPAIRST